jgi:hypothetical protein
MVKMLNKIVVLMLGVLLAFVGIGIGTASDDFKFSEVIMRPSTVSGVDYFNYQDTATVSGWNQWSHQSVSTLGGFNSMSIFETLEVPQGAAPLSESFETVTLSSMKGGEPADPWMFAQIDSWITVGAVNIGDPENPVSRYDKFTYNLGGMFDAESGFRSIDTLITSTQDDYIHVLVGDNAGFDYPVLSSYAEVTIPGMPGQSQKFREFNFMDTRGWDLATFDWQNSMTMEFKVYPIVFNQP